MSSRSGRKVTLSEGGRSRRPSGSVFERLGSHSSKDREKASGKKVCRHWASRGECPYDDCKFSHENAARGPSPEPRSATTRKRPLDDSGSSASPAKKIPSSSHKKERPVEEPPPPPHKDKDKEVPLSVDVSLASSSLHDLSDISDDDDSREKRKRERSSMSSSVALKSHVTAVGGPLPSVIMKSEGEHRGKEAISPTGVGEISEPSKKTKVVKIVRGTGQKEERRGAGSGKSSATHRDDYKRDEKKESVKVEKEKDSGKRDGKGKRDVKERRERHDKHGRTTSRDEKEKPKEKTKEKVRGGKEREKDKGKERGKERERKSGDSKRDRTKSGGGGGASRDKDKAIATETAKGKKESHRGRERRRTEGAEEPLQKDAARGKETHDKTTSSRKRKREKSTSPSYQRSKEKRLKESEESTILAPVPATELHIVDEVEDVDAVAAAATDSKAETKQSVSESARGSVETRERERKDSAESKSKEKTPLPPAAKEKSRDVKREKSKGRSDRSSAKSDRREPTTKETKKKDDDAVGGGGGGSRGSHHDSRARDASYRRGKRSSDRSGGGSERSSYRHHRDRSKERGRRERSRAVRDSETEHESRKRDDSKTTAVSEQDLLKELQLETLSDAADSDGLDDNRGKMLEMMVGRDVGISVDWEGLLREDATARRDETESLLRRWTPAAILSRVGVSDRLAGAELMSRVTKDCPVLGETTLGASAAALAAKRADEGILFSNIGSCRRALTARQDLNIRAKLRAKSDRMLLPSVQPPVTDKEIYSMAVGLYSEKADSESNTGNKIRLVESNIGSVLVHV
ncbi:protein starmaker-like isoform X2 [Oscarella lobularis]|uniref:protein starmaker-like isoform X2 n=1 Tax=Oscarella lobularis TaxID=121494 RepID=UPI00331350D2